MQWALVLVVGVCPRLPPGVIVRLVRYYCSPFVVVVVVVVTIIIIIVLFYFIFLNSSAARRGPLDRACRLRP